MKLLKDIIVMGAADIKTSNLTLITLSAAEQALQALHMPAFILEAAKSLKHPDQLILILPAAVLRQQNAAISLQPVHLHLDDDLPTTLDPSPPVLGERERYSLTQHPTLSCSALLQLQMREFKSWCTRDFQAGRGYDSVQSITWEQTEKELMLMLGFAHYKKGWVQPGLGAACNASLLNSYIAARKMRGDAWSTGLKTFSATMKLIAWWQSKPSLAPEQVQKLAALRDWLADMRSQLSKVWHNVIRDPVTLHEQGKWMHAKDVVCLFEQHRHGVMEAFANVSRVLSPAQARRVHDITLCCCMFGWMPPLRLYCIRTVTAPSVSRVCSEVGCSTPARPCAGNSITVTPSASLSFHLPHHKNSLRWGKLAIQFAVPPGLHELLQLYLDKARPVLLAENEVSLPHLFFTTTGHKFSSSRFCQYFQEIMVKMGAPAIAPKDLRHIFVVDRCDDTSVPGPVNAGAAMVMGHSERAWHNVYDLKYSRRMADDAVSAMADWRAHHLAGRVASGAVPNSLQPETEDFFVGHAEGMVQGADVAEEDNDGDDSDEELLTFARSQPLHGLRRFSSSPEDENDIEVDIS